MCSDLFLNLGFLRISVEEIVAPTGSLPTVAAPSGAWGKHLMGQGVIARMRMCCQQALRYAKRVVGLVTVTGFA